MSKMRYFSNKSSKIAYNSDLKFRIWPNCGVSNWLWRNRIFEHFSDVITVTSPKNVTKFFLALPNQNFWLRQWIKVIIIVISYFQSTVIVIEKSKM